MSLSPCLYTTIRVTESVGQRIWHKEQHSLAQSPCFPPDLQQDLPSVPQLLAVCHFLLGCPLFPLLLTRSGSSPYKLPVSETLQSHCLTFYLDTQAVCWVLRASLSVHLYRQPIISMRLASVAFPSVKSWPSQLPEVELPQFPMRLCCAAILCVCYIILLVFLSLSLICRIILKTHIYNLDTLGGHNSTNQHHYEAAKILHLFTFHTDRTHFWL